SVVGSPLARAALTAVDSCRHGSTRRLSPNHRKQGPSWHFQGGACSWLRGRICRSIPAGVAKSRCESARLQSEVSAMTKPVTKPTTASIANERSVPLAFLSELAASDDLTKIVARVVDMIASAVAAVLESRGPLPSSGPDPIELALI